MKLIYPLKGIGTKPGIFLTQRFGENLNNYAQFGLKGHNGIDWAAPLGTPVLAVADGTVEFWRDTDPTGIVFKGYGLNARLWVPETPDTKLEWTYGHFRAFEGENRQVKKGDIIGYVNSTGFSTGNHLHLGVRRWYNGTVENYNNGYFGYFDPAPLFEQENNRMEVMQIQGEQTLVIKNLLGKYLVIATTPEHYAEVAGLLGIQDGQQLPTVARAEVDANLVGTARSGLTLNLN